LVNYLCIIQARLNSSRLPAKIMLDLAGKTLIERVFNTVSKSKAIDKVIVAISDEKSDDIVAMKLEQLKIDYFRGDLDNVLKRFYDTEQKYRAKNIVRITADNPLMDAKIIDSLIQEYEKNKTTDYSMYSNAIHGLSAEVFCSKALHIAYHNTNLSFDIEHVTPYIKNTCKIHIVDIDKKYRRPDLSVTIDTLSDYIKMQKFYLYCKKLSLEVNIDTFMELIDDKKRMSI